MIPYAGGRAMPDGDFRFYESWDKPDQAAKWRTKLPNGMAKEE